MNGESRSSPSPSPLRLGKGRSVIEAVYVNAVLQFSADDWQAVELIKDGRTNFRILAQKGYDLRIDLGRHTQFNPSAGKFPLGFEQGTAMFLNDFVWQYDEEDGVVGNLTPAEIVDALPAASDATNAARYAGWTVVLSENRLAATNLPATQPGGIPCGRVMIDREKKVILVEGITQGALRRAMVVLMRLVDRKYPHVGRFLGLRGFYSEPFVKDGELQWRVWRPRSGMPEFFKGIADPQWVLKPLLREEHESLYDGSTLDFAGKYALKTAPYLFEPTFNEDFVFGYAGAGRAETKEDLEREAKPPQP